MNSSKYHSLFFCLLLIENLSVILQILVSSSRLRSVSENEEVHYEIWKERRVNYFDENQLLDNNINHEDTLVTHFYPREGISHEFSKRKNIGLVPKVMIDLFNENLKIKSSDIHSENQNSDLVVRSFKCKDFENESSEKILIQFGFDIIKRGEQFQKAQLTLQINSNSSFNFIGNQNKLSRTGIFINGKFESIKLQKGTQLIPKEVTFDATNAVKTWIKLRNHLVSNLKIYLENTRWSKLNGFTMKAKDAILIVYTIVNPLEDDKLELEELIHHEEEVMLDKKHSRQKRNTLSNEISIIPLVAPPHPGEDYEEVEEFNSDINRNLLISNRLGIHGKQLNAHVRRHLAKKMWGPCRKRPFYVNFSEVKFDSWIIAPKGYQAYECYGRCGFPLGAHLTPTKHAIMRAMLNGISPKKATRACCVPTKLEPMSLLYMDDNGVVTYKYNYDDMIVAECGCR